MAFSLDDEDQARRHLLLRRKQREERQVLRRDISVWLSRRFGRQPGLGPGVADRGRSAVPGDGVPGWLTTGSVAMAPTASISNPTAKRSWVSDGSSVRRTKRKSAPAPGPRASRSSRRCPT